MSRALLFWTQCTSELVSDVMFADIDECVEGKHNCSRLANCTNTMGGFTCQCLPGVIGNGTHCKGLVKIYFIAHGVS